jgi:hypothetical protein
MPGEMSMCDFLRGTGQLEGEQYEESTLKDMGRAELEC